MKSIIQTERRCYMCGSYQWLEEHHVYSGWGVREISEKYGLKVFLCHYCHNEPPNGVHQNRENRLALQEKVQKIAMKYYGWTKDEFRQRIGQNYID